MRFEFATAGRIVFGCGTAAEIGPAAKSLGTRALVVTGKSPDRAAKRIAGISFETFPVSGEPALDDVRRGVEAARRAGCDVVIGFGGGSAIDAAKAIAALLTNEGDPLDYLEVIGSGRALLRPSLPCIAVPTTAGTGAEVTRNSVLGSPEHGVKASLRSPFLLPRLAIVDPELTIDLPSAITAATGMDALTQLIEPYVSTRANPVTDALCVEGIRLVAGALRRAFDDGANIEARTDMALASLYGGIALANAGLGAVHGFAAPIGGRFRAPHGAVCAALLPHVMAANITAMGSRADRYGTLARILTGKPDAVPEDASRWAEGLRADLRIPPLSAFGIDEASIPALVADAAKASSMKANPVVLDGDQLTSILRRAI